MSRDMDEMKLTAYALGELEGAERDAVEARLAASVVDRRFVDEVRAMAHVVSNELAGEPGSSLDAIHYAAIELRLREPLAVHRHRDRREVVRARIGFGMTLAASVAIVCGTIGAVLLLMSHEHPVAVKTPATQPTERPILIPFEQLKVAENSIGPAASPAGSDANPFVNVSDQSVSSFAMSADTGSYEELRRALIDDRLPARDSVKIEGLINAFAYDYPKPLGDAVFAGQIEVGACPWALSHKLARVAVKAKEGAGNVAEDVRTEVAFDKNAIQSWRLIGYDQPAGRASGGESVAGGHAITVLYELIPTDRPVSQDSLLTLSVRYRVSQSSTEHVARFVGQNQAPQVASVDFRFAAAVAEFGMLVRDSSHHGNASVDAVIELAEAARGPDATGERGKFIELVHRSRELLG